MVKRGTLRGALYFHVAEYRAMKIDALVFKLHKALRKALEADKHYLLAVSGGSDSMALLSACMALQNEGYGTYSVCHVEHGLRGEEAIADADFVASFCKERCIPCFVEHVDVLAQVAEQGLSVEEAARNLRHGVLQSVALREECDTVVFAHNSDDQVETVLMNILRGTGLKGLGGIRGCSHAGLHPLLGFSHAQLAEYCRVQGIAYRHDSSNDDLVYTRNRIRHELVPYLEQNFNSNLCSSLTTMAMLMQEENDALDAIAWQAFAEAAAVDTGAETDGCCVRIYGKKLKKYPAAVAKRVIRKAYAALSRATLSYERTQAVYDLYVRNAGGKTVQLPNGFIVSCAKGVLIFQRLRVAGRKDFSE